MTISAKAPILPLTARLSYASKIPTTASSVLVGSDIVYFTSSEDS
jgi:hypothetical protein